jgi:nitrogenase molybdenum-iron protein alpha/beta subunit/MoaA/NifB/PqqE/SkfB family radical SAM enzyme
MGAVTALAGLRGCMTILHGSQGCATYIRRHMATHYNEPVDIASSSLTEEGTVFGGEKNLVKGIENLVNLYDPDVIGVCTTCLAETIGEDVPRILADFKASRPDLRAGIINVTSAGYSGTQYEGFFRALRAAAEQVEPDAAPNGRINIITGHLSAADTRRLKALLKEMSVDAILLPDLSENLDGGHEETYSRLPRGGTPVSDVAKMAGARASIELAAFIDEARSPARYLLEAHGVPFIRLNPPVGLRDTDAFIKALASLGGVVTPELKKERARCLDAMIDSHKYNAKAVAAVFGEPDFAYSVTRLLTENGARVALAATGSVCRDFAEKILAETGRVRDYHIDSESAALDDCDFDTIERRAAELGVNILIGSSDGRRAAEHLKLPLVRCAFPIHDHVGGQRVRMLGYDGAAALLDRVTNTVLSNVEETFRGEMFEKYHRAESVLTPRGAGNSISPHGGKVSALPHPCFDGCSSKYARLHLPVAPSCNIRCNYCVRDYDCPNESRPGVTSGILSPAEALERFRRVRAALPELAVAGIAGPGDALADFGLTRETLSLIRGEDKNVSLCVSTNGLLLPFYADELSSLGVTHVTVTVNAANPTIGARVYGHIDYFGERFYGDAAAGILLANQLAGIARCAALGITVKVNAVMIKGVNDSHIPDIASRVRGLGCSITNIMRMIPVPGSAFENIPPPGERELEDTRLECEKILPQLRGCRGCRADAAGTLDRDFPLSDISRPAAPEPCGKRAPSARFAVSSKNGVLVDTHFGHTTEFYIYEYSDGGARLRERRPVEEYCAGEEGTGGAGKMDRILKTIEDCDYVLSARIGDSPRGRLASRGVKIHTSYAKIEDAILEAVTKYERSNAI